MLVFLIFLVGCNSHSDKRIIGVSLGKSDEWHTQLHKDLLSESYFNEQFVLQISEANNDEQKQIQFIENLIEDRVDLIVVSPLNANSIVPVVEKAYRKNIPVIVLKTKLTTERYTAFVGTDFGLLGRLIAYNILKEKSVERVLEICNNDEPEVSQLIHNNFNAFLDTCEHVQRLGSFYVREGSRDCERLIDSLMACHADMDLIFSHSDKIALEAKRCVDSLIPENKIRFLGIGGFPNKNQGIDFVERGLIDATYIVSTGADIIFQVASDILNYKPYIKDNYLASPMVDLSRSRIIRYQNRAIGKLNDKIVRLRLYVSNYIELSKIRLYLIIGMVVLILVAGLVICYIAWLLKNRNRINKLLNNQNEELLSLSKKLEDTTQSKLVFFTNISHDIKTPLTLITDPIHYLIKNTKLTKEQSDLLNIASKNSTILMRLVDQILDFRSFEHGKLKLTYITVDLQQLISEWISAFNGTAKHNNKEIRFVLSKKIDFTISIDVQKIERVFYNLLSNAIKYSSGKGVINVELLKAESNIILKVRNECVNLRADSLENIFDRFYQVDHSSDGSGIGLAISKSYVALHNGEINIELIQEGLLEVSVSLPIVCQPEDALNDETMVLPESDKLLVLVVEDNEDMRTHIVNILRTDYNVLSAVNGEDGLKVAKQNIPDLIVSDIMMPIMDGIEMCKRLKNELITCHIPLLLLTARGLDVQKLEGYESGADGYITKPFNFEMLKARAKNLIDNRKLIKLSDTKVHVPKKIEEKEKKFIDKFNEVILKNMGNDRFDIETIGEELNYSRVQVYRKVKALTGETPVKLLRIARLQKAEQLLQTTEKTISEVAFEVGFSSPSYFSKTYKEFFGISPNSMRNQ